MNCIQKNQAEFPRSGRFFKTLAGVLVIMVLGSSRLGAQEPKTRPDMQPEPIPVIPAPNFKRVFLDLPTDEGLRQEMEKERRLGPPPPKEPVPPAEAKPIRSWQALTETVEPTYTCYGRLYFEQINAERYGWDLGLFHPFLSAGVFYADVVLLPFHMGTEPFRKYECNAGYCLPGDWVPLLLYPPEIQWTGIASEAATIGILLAIFP